ncbi:MAG: serine protease Do [Alphaproteobacteria bacterium]|jgi:serine protease Do
MKNATFTFILSITLLIMQDATAINHGGFADLVEKQSPAVVNVSTTTKAKKKTKQIQKELRQKSPFTKDPFFDKFFNDFMGGMEGLMDEQSRQPKSSLGSGVVISKDGYVVTNNHVAGSAESEILIKFQDGTELKAKVIGKDKKNDLSLLKVEADKDLPFATLGDSDAIRVGDWTIAIGNPFGLGGTVTAGILSARSRNIQQGPYDDFLQTDAAINPGNSGGPLFNEAGEIIGINTAILSRTGGNQGIGFAVPSNTVKHIIAQIKEHGHPVRGWLGVRIQTVTKELAEALGLTEQKGALVATVMADSPAEKGGIKEGDLILSVDGKPLKEMSDLPKLIAETPVDKKIKIKLKRGDKTKTLTVTIAKLDEEEEAILLGEGDGLGKSDAIAGMILSELDNDAREALGVEVDTKGVVVSSVEYDRRAERSGLRSGDIILEIKKKKMMLIKDVETALNLHKEKSLLMLILRDGDKHFVAFKKAEADDMSDE